MTAIVGLVDTDRTIYIGADTCGTNRAGDQDVFTNQKVFSLEHAPSFLIGVCGSFRLGQVLRYQFKPPKPPGPNESFEEYISTEFVASLYKALKGAGLFDDSIGEGVAGEFLVGYQGKLALVENNMQAMFTRRSFTATGDGEAYCKGSLYATEGMSPSDRVHIALKAASAFMASVREPFECLSIAFDENWSASKVKRKRGKK